MTTSTYPAEVDAIPRPVPGGPGVGTELDAAGDLGHAAQHIRVADALQATQETLGVMPQGSHSSVAARLAAAGDAVHLWCVTDAEGHGVLTADGEVPGAGNLILVPAGYAISLEANVIGVAADGAMIYHVFAGFAVRPGAASSTTVDSVPQALGASLGGATFSEAYVELHPETTLGAVQIMVGAAGEPVRWDARVTHIQLTAIPVE